MFDIFAEMQESGDDELRAIQAAVKELEAHEVLVGIPEEDAARQAGDGVSNAELLFIHTNGSQLKGIPARPVVEPAIEDDTEPIADLLQKASDAALSGKKDGVVPALERAGMQGQNAARGWFTNPSNGWAPNADSTINGHEFKDKDGNVTFKTKGKGSDRPLIDTGELRKSITYKVRKG